MTASNSNSCAAYFIFTQIFILIVVNGEFSILRNTSKPEFIRSAVREKRSVFDRAPLILKMTIQCDSNQQIDLMLIKQISVLANEHLPVVEGLSDLNYDVMTDVGEFVIYQDIEKCVAVIYFVKAEALYGVIGITHYIHGIPFSFDEKGKYQLGVVGEPFIRKNRLEVPHIDPTNVFPPLYDTNAWEDFLHMEETIPTGSKRPASSDPGPSTKRQHTDEEHEKHDGKKISGSTASCSSMTKTITMHFYLETLVFVTHDLVQLFKTNYEDDYIAAIVRYHMIYFNAVDVIIKQLESFDLRVHINIAKIVIENESRPLGFVNDGEVQFTDIVIGMTEYLDTHQNEYPPDSFDYVFIHTSRSVMDYNVIVRALTRHGEDIYEARKRNEPYSAVPITVMTFPNYYGHYVTAAHEIGRTFNMKLTPKEVGLQVTGQCHNIMQREGPKCGNCLKWSDDDRRLFSQFFTSNRNRCFLLNEPRSVRPPGSSKSVTPDRQCQCFGYYSYIMSRNRVIRGTVGTKGCSKPLVCKKSATSNSNHEFTILPFDGTACCYNKVCWNGICMTLPWDRLKSLTAFKYFSSSTV